MISTNNNKEELNQLLDLLTVEGSNIYILLNEIKNIKHEVKSIMADPEPTPAMIERLSALEKQFNQDAPEQSSSLNKKLARFDKEIEKIDKTFTRLTGKTLLASKEEKSSTSKLKKKSRNFA